ncbi:MAG: transglycosylase SLT domain-containing protein [Steroidobacter sp.]
MSRMFHTRFLLACLLILASGMVAAAGTLTAERGEFMRALDAVQHDKTPGADSKALKKYVLYPYLQAARLLKELQHTPADKQLNQRITTFLNAQGNAPAIRELRHQWLLSLASRAEWKIFLAHYHDDGDVELRCQSINALLATQHESDVAVLIPPLWLNSERLAAACNAPFQWARDNHIITPALLEQRIRLALKAGNYQLARDLLGDLPEQQAAPLRQWASMIENPLNAIDAVIAHPNVQIETTALQDGWTRLARKDPDAAIARLPRLINARALSDTDASPYILNLALALAWNRRSETLEYFARVAPRDMNDQACEWQARAALWRGDWQLVSKLINAMPAALKAQVRWRYWQLRAVERTQGIDAARAAYQQLMDNEDNYFAALAAARINKPYSPHPLAFSFDNAVVQKLASMPDMQRIRELVAVQLTQQALNEWNTVLPTLSTAEQFAAASLAHQWGWYEQTILITAKQLQFSDYEFLYPHPFDEEVKSGTHLSGLPADLIYGLLRQESLYRRDAKSAAGALGLTQLIPASARLTAKQLKLSRPSDEDLFKPAVNIPLGAVHLKQLIDSFNGHVVLALAAYNGGPTATRRWLPDSFMDSDVWIENIPFNETRVYVPRVLWHALIFEWLRTGKPVDATGWLKPVKS